jgi:hypothetical protein
MSAATLASSILTISLDCVPAIRAKLTERLEPSASVIENDPAAWCDQR